MQNHWEKAKKAKKAKYLGECGWEPSIWHFRMRFCFFCSGDDVFKSYFEENVGLTGRGGHSYMLAPPHCWTNLITRATKAKSHAEVPNVGSHLHSPEYFVFFVFCVFSQWFCMVIKWDLCFVWFCCFSCSFALFYLWDAVGCPHDQKWLPINLSVGLGNEIIVFSIWCCV